MKSGALWCCAFAEAVVGGRVREKYRGPCEVGCRKFNELGSCDFPTHSEEITPQNVYWFL
jgi:hypothetical protein